MTDAVEMLNADPGEKNWKEFSAALKKSSAVYYRPVFGRGRLRNTQGLRNSHVELYDKNGKLLFKIPIFKKNGKELRGATMYLKGLLIKN